LRLTVGRSVCLGVEYHLGLMTRYLLTVWQLRSCPIRTPSLTRGRVSLLSQDTVPSTSIFPLL
jgi:hypothetical protein